MRTLNVLLVGAVLSIFALPTSALAQTGRVVGTVVDANTGESLPGANVIIQGTTIGAAADLNGEFAIIGVPAGTHTLVASYVSYQRQERVVEVEPGGVVRVEIEMPWVGVVGQEVTITAQARGQNQAINEQLTARTIKNVVSAERIRELPDESAATALSRLPGVSIQEGDKIVIRGIQAKMNVITVNGIQLPATDLQDRSTNLGFISSNMLSGVEVTKAVTPAMDANSIGGTVNLRLREAPEGVHGDAMLQGDYNTQDQTYQNYRAWGSVSNRFLGNRLGAFLQGNARRFEGGQDIANITYTGTGADPGYGQRPYQATQINFADQVNVTEEYGGSLMLDYRLPQGKLVLQNTFATVFNDNTTHLDRLYLAGASARSRDIRVEREISDRLLLINALQGEHRVVGLTVDWGLSHARSEKDTDLNYALNFSRTNQAWPETHAFSQEQLINFEPEMVYDLPFTQGGPTPTALEGATRPEQFSERRLNANLNLTLPVVLTRTITGDFRAGGKVEQLARENDVTRYYARLSDAATNAMAVGYLESIGADPNSPLSFAVFQNQNYARGSGFLGQRREMTSVVNTALMDGYMRIAPPGWNNGEPHYADSHRFDYIANEQISAAYVMGDFNVGRRLSVLTGVRYENFSMDYMAPFVFQTHFAGEGGVADTLNIERSIGHWFPNLQLRYNFTDWFDVRLAFTTTLSRPDYSQLLPSTFIFADENRGEAGNPFLEPTVSQNYDAYLSFYTNRIGLFTIGGFLKQMDDVILQQRILRRDVERYQGVFWVPEIRPEEGFVDLGPTNEILTFINNPNSALLRGFEVDWQTNFWYLPQPFNSLVFNINYTRIHSEMDYLQVQSRRQLRDPSNPFSGYEYVVADTVRTARLLQQGNNIINMAVGADIAGFSGRVSFRYQGDVVTGIERRPEADTFKENVYALDFAIRQRLPVEGLVAFLNGLNITHAPEIDNRYYPVQAGGAVAQRTSRLAYNPRRFQLGLRYSF